MKISIPLTDIMVASGKRFAPASCSENEVIERIQRIYGVIAQAMDISVKDGMAECDVLRHLIGTKIKKPAFYMGQSNHCPARGIDI